MSDPLHTIALHVVREGVMSPQHDTIAVEAPLEIRLGTRWRDARVARSVSITMRSPGHDDDLAAGFLFTEGILHSAAQILSVGPCTSGRENVIRVDLRDDVEVDWKRLERHVYTSSSCGVCGKTSLDAVRSQCAPLPPPSPSLTLATLGKLDDAMRDAQAGFARTGGSHATALFDPDGALLLLREDVGRHNAMDKVIGYALRHNLTPLHEHIMLVSGRASFELIQKALVAGVTSLVAIGAPSSLAVELAREQGMTLIGFLRHDRFNVYSGPERLHVEAQP